MSLSRVNPVTPKLSVQLALNQEDVLASQQLRYRVFALEQGAKLASAHLQLDCDAYDAYCYHLLVRENATGEVVGSTRILTAENARRAGGFYSASEFDLSKLLPLDGKAIEIGRTCIHPDYRNGFGISTLWLGLAQFIELHQVDYLFGCASISMQDGGSQAHAIMEQVRQQHLAPIQHRITPRYPIPPCAISSESTSMPPLLKTYLKLGAWVGGEACLDEDFNVADLFILLDMDHLNTRYHRRFMQGCLEQTQNNMTLQAFFNSPSAV